jgi:UDP-N-acetylmuramate--alanine ligase
VAVLNNVTLDHKSLDELRRLFHDFAAKAKTIVVNLDDDETRLLAAALPRERLKSFSFRDPAADLYSPGVADEAGRIRFEVTDRKSGETQIAELPLWGAHNGQNALAAIAACQAAGVGIADSITALGSFAGLRRRFEIIGERSGIIVIDDFGHNPDKIAATLQAARAGLGGGRLLVFFQPHGYGPLKIMKDELIACFVRELSEEDRLLLSDPVYFGGTVERAVGSGDIVDGVVAAGRHAEHIPDRAACGDRLAALARPGDRILVMGARDDTLSAFAADLLGRL